MLLRAAPTGCPKAMASISTQQDANKIIERRRLRIVIVIDYSFVYRDRLQLQTHSLLLLFAVRCRTANVVRHRLQLIDNDWQVPFI